MRRTTKRPAAFPAPQFWGSGGGSANKSKRRQSQHQGAEISDLRGAVNPREEAEKGRLAPPFHRNALVQGDVEVQVQAGRTLLHRGDVHRLGSHDDRGALDDHGTLADVDRMLVDIALVFMDVALVSVAIVLVAPVIAIP